MRCIVFPSVSEDAGKAELFRFVYHDHRWMEREIQSVANVTAADIATFLRLAVKAVIRTQVETVPLDRANEALLRLKRGRVTGSLVLEMP